MAPFTGIMSMVDKNVLSETKSFTVTCTCNTMNVAPNGDNFTQKLVEHPPRGFYLTKGSYSGESGYVLLNSLQLSYKVTILVICLALFKCLY